MDNRKIGIIVGIGVLVACCVLTVIGVAAYMFLAAPEGASEPIEAVPLIVATDVPAEAQPAEESGSESESTSSEESGDQSAAEPAGGTPQIFIIQQAGSQARFELDEDLRGNRITVIGTTDQVAGQIAIDYANLAATELGIITINARTLVTDNDFRNRAIQREILETGPYEFITFTPTSIDGLPDSINVGETATFNVIGDLTIRDQTNSVNFSVTVTAISETEIGGNAFATVTREMYGIGIPSVPGVANVEDEIELYIDFIANSG